MRLKLNLENIPALSTNRLTRAINGKKFPRVIKSLEYREFEAAVANELKGHQYQLKEFANYFNPKEHYLLANWYFYHPNVLTKTGKIHRRGGDVFNCIKAIEDCLCRALNIDDSFIIGGSAYKVQSEKVKTVVEFVMCDLSKINM